MTVRINLALIAAASIAVVLSGAGAISVADGQAASGTASGAPATALVITSPDAPAPLHRDAAVPGANPAFLFA